ncbi:hypothetical protein HYS91_04790 [Candidatus Daviesbacteria bacterium]|nr:hypothetical protein [Candidatus Daviesbacteria bacterium]
MNFWDKWKFKYLTVVLISVLIAIILAENETFKNFLHNLGSLEYVGALSAGLLFVSTFTFAISTVIIVLLSQDIHPLAIALIGGVGAVLGDLLIFKLIKDKLGHELALLIGKEETHHIKALLKSRYVSWTLPLIGAFIIASPLPDELGISLLGLTKISDTKFILISYLSNSFGILTIASVVRVLQI